MRTRVNTAVESPPLRRVLVLRLDVLKGDGEVDEVKVEVVDAPELELVLGDLLGLYTHSILERMISPKGYMRTFSFWWKVFQSWN